MSTVKASHCDLDVMKNSIETWRDAEKFAE